MDLAKLQHSLTNPKRAPVESWNPPFCGDIDIRIGTDGRWYYMNSPIGRMPLVKLFASVLKQENDEYFLVTPAEKVRIKVDDLPFVITEWQFVEHNNVEFIQVTTNVAERYLLTAHHPLLQINHLPAIRIRDQFLARVHRNVYYQWAELVNTDRDDEAPGYYLTSGGERFFFAQR